VGYVTTWERKGIEKGFQKGILQKSHEDVADILDTRFQRVPQTLVQTIQSIEDTALLSKLHREAVLVESIEKFEQLVEDTVTRQQ
jgi:hypothetical protein